MVWFFRASLLMDVVILVSGTFMFVHNWNDIDCRTCNSHRVSAVSSNIIGAEGICWFIRVHKIFAGLKEHIIICGYKGQLFIIWVNFSFLIPSSHKQLFLYRFRKTYCNYKIIYKTVFCLSVKISITSELIRFSVLRIFI